jgi:hypothetical protein
LIDEEKSHCSLEEKQACPVVVDERIQLCLRQDCPALRKHPGHGAKGWKNLAMDILSPRSSNYKWLEDHTESPETYEDWRKNILPRLHYGDLRAPCCTNFRLTDLYGL